MAFITIPNVAIKGISACVPPKVEENRDIPFYSPEEAQKVIETTGVERKHLVDANTTAADLCQKACEVLLSNLGWEAESIDAICYVTQTPDYTNHPTGFVIHDRMNLKADCMVFDLYEGCPGWVVGLNTLTSLISHGSIKRAILFDGDNVTKGRYLKDREFIPLFGDCGTATALEYDQEAPAICFHHGTNSKDGEALIVKRGGARLPHTLDSFSELMKLRSGELSPEDVSADVMDGMSVFSFGISAPPKSVKKLCEYCGISLDNVDKLVLHQANLFMLQKIAKKLKIDMTKVPNSLKDFGNTTSASIPLTIASQCRDEYSTKKMKSVVCAFGTGLAWASAFFETDRMVVPDIIIY